MRLLYVKVMQQRLHPGFDPGEDWNSSVRVFEQHADFALLHPGFDPGEDWNYSGRAAQSTQGRRKLHPGFDPGEDWNTESEPETQRVISLHPGFDPGEDWNCRERGEVLDSRELHPGFDPGEDWNVLDWRFLHTPCCTRVSTRVRIGTCRHPARCRSRYVAPGFRPG